VPAAIGTAAAGAEIFGVRAHPAAVVARKSAQIVVVRSAVSMVRLLAE
jgi:hypothetical protein